MFIGIDVTIMCLTGLLCLGLVVFVCWKFKLPEDYAEITIGITAICVAIMIVSYIVMAYVLDRVIGIYW